MHTLHGDTHQPVQGQTLRLKRGDIFFAPDNVHYRILTPTHATLSKATVPLRPGSSSGQDTAAGPGKVYAVQVPPP